MPEDAATQTREAYYTANADRLAQLAHKAYEKGRKLDEFFVICIDADDPAWKELVDGLMPDQNWFALRARGEKPFARGTLLRNGLEEVIAKMIPGIAPIINDAPPAGHVLVILLAEGGGSAGYLVPQPE